MPPARRWIFAGLAVVSAGSLWLIIDGRRSLAMEEMAGRLPHHDRMLAGIDVGALRRSGMLERIAGKAGFEEGDYRQFVADTGFDYRRDLDSVLASYTAAETHFFLRGRFDWQRLANYAVKQGGQCALGSCRLASSTPGRQISFAMADRTTLALASSADSGAAGRLLERAQPLAALPGAPAWLLLPRAVLAGRDSLPAGTRSFASAVEDAERVTLSFDAKNRHMEAELEARFATADKAESAMRHMQTATALLNKMMARDKESPNPRNLTGVLAGGQFRTEGASVKGTWPMEEAFLEGLGQ